MNISKALKTGFYLSRDNNIIYTKKDAIFYDSYLIYDIIDLGMKARPKHVVFEVVDFDDKIKIPSSVEALKLIGINNIFTFENPSSIRLLSFFTLYISDEIDYLFDFIRKFPNLEYLEIGDIDGSQKDIKKLYDFLEIMNIKPIKSQEFDWGFNFNPRDILKYTE